MTDTIQLAKECGGVLFERSGKVAELIISIEELEAFRKRIEDEMKKKIIQEHDFFIDEPWLADSIRSMK